MKGTAATPHDDATAASARSQRKSPSKVNDWRPREIKTKKWLKNQRRMLNFEMGKWNKAIHDSTQAGLADQLKCSKQNFFKAMVKMHYIDHHGIFILDKGGKVKMTPEQQKYNKELIALETYTADPFAKQMANTYAKGKEAPAWITQMCMAMVAQCASRVEAALEVETTYARYEYQQWFVAEYGQEEWEKFLEGRVSPSDP